MKRYKIMLNSIDLVKSFVSMINSYNIQADLHCGSYSVDAQSILGIFSLNLAQELMLILRTIYPESDLKDFEDKLQKYVVV